LKKTRGKFNFLHLLFLSHFQVFYIFLSFLSLCFLCFYSHECTRSEFRIGRVSKRKRNYSKGRFTLKNYFRRIFKPTHELNWNKKIETFLSSLFFLSFLFTPTISSQNKSCKIRESISN